MNREQHRISASTVARQWLERPFLILDTETTGLKHADPVEIGILSSTGDVLMDTYCVPDKDIEAGAAGIHGITLSRLLDADAPVLAQIAPTLADILRDQLVLIYNRQYDEPIIRSLLSRDGWKCVPARGRMLHRIGEFYCIWMIRHVILGNKRDQGKRPGVKWEA